MLPYENIDGLQQKNSKINNTFVNFFFTFYSKLPTFTYPAFKVVQIRGALVPVPSPYKWRGLRQEGHPA